MTNLALHFFGIVNNQLFIFALFFGWFSIGLFYSLEVWLLSFPVILTIAFLSKLALTHLLSKNVLRETR